MFDDNGSFLLALFEFFIFFAYLMCLFWIFSDLFRSHDLGGWAKFFWVLFIFILPFIGMLVYVIARGSGMTQRAIDQQKEMQKAQVEYAHAIVSQTGGGASATDQITQAKGLLDSGAITQAEFDAIKAKALS
jgi:hypothetical protein